MKRFFRLIPRKDAVLYLYGVLCIAAQVGLAVAIPQKMGDITQMLQRGECGTGDILVQGLIMTAYSLLSLAAAVLTSRFISRAGGAFDRSLRRMVFEKTLSFSLEEVGSFGTSSLISRCTGDITQVQSFFTGCFQISVESVMTIIWVVACMAGTNRIWSVSTAAAVLIICASLTVITVRTMPAVRRVQYVNDRLIEVSREHITGIRVVHAYDAFGFQKERYEDVNGEQTALHLFYDRAMAGFEPGARAVLYLLSVAVYVSGAYIISSAGAAEKLGVFSGMVEYISYSGMLVASFIYLIVVASTVPNTIVSASRIMEVLDRDVTIADPERETEAADEKRGEVEFSHVSFRYPGAKEYVLSDVSFKVKKGETAAIIGATGCGKTSLINLIPRLYDATEGEVLVGGVNVKEYNLKHLRNILGYVPQKSFLFSGTVAENIAFGDNGRPRADLNEIKRAAETGQAAGFIAEKEKAYDSPVSQGGSNFSGGQRQRLTISRAVCRDPEIYLFDDSFSALDYMTDSAVRRKLRGNAGDATMLIVAQRISTVRNADRIIVMDKGRIVGEGTHDSLLKSCGIYREIAESQNSEDGGND